MIQHFRVERLHDIRDDIGRIRHNDVGLRDRFASGFPAALNEGHTVLNAHPDSILARQTQRVRAQIDSCSPPAGAIVQKALQKTARARTEIDNDSLLYALSQRQRRFNQPFTIRPRRQCALVGEKAQPHKVDMPDDQRDRFTVLTALNHLIEQGSQRIIYDVLLAHNEVG